MPGYFAGFSAVPKFSARVTLDPANCGAATATEQLFTVKGVRPGMFMVVTSVNALETGLAIGHARAAGKDSLGIVFVNPTAGGINPASQDFLVIGL